MVAFIYFLSFYVCDYFLSLNLYVCDKIKTTDY